ncbi:TetR/AcrR family transcriptional regulator [Sphingomonas sp. LB2R24]|uniref:TetR/AcrR family transcriptional regulator n=1 Tax=Sphingomonas sorbitolis TaxID=3096165 RepID=UPI002FCBAD2E
MTETEPKWTRRKDARPGEIIEAALELFVLNGFAATKLTEVAQRAGVVKGTLYRYFDTKEDLFRASVRHLVGENLALVGNVLPIEAKVAALVPALLRQLARAAHGSRIPSVIRMVLAESRSFPDLAEIWRDEVVAPMLDAIEKIIATGQSNGEVRAGNPRYHALSILGPMVTGALYKQLFAGEKDQWPEMEALAIQHAETIIAGLCVDL